MRARRRLLVMPVAAVLFASSSVVRSAGPEEAIRSRGKELYRVYCKNCHGESAEGHGPMARLLTVRPSDLTRLADPDGKFPFERVYRTIDGGFEVRGHGASEMPVWGLSFRDRGSDVDQSDEVRGRILALVEYLTSIQRTRPGGQSPAGTPAPETSPVPAGR